MYVSEFGITIKFKKVNFSFPRAQARGNEKLTFLNFIVIPNFVTYIHDEENYATRRSESLIVFTYTQARAKYKFFLVLISIWLFFATYVNS